MSEIGLGCWQLGGLSTINGIPTTYGDVNETTAFNIVKRAIQLGINVFDTADVYSLGNSEKRLGKDLKDYRSEIHILTKAGGIPSYNSTKPYEIDLSYHHLIAALDRSLKRLDTKYVDIFQAHAAPKSDDDIENLEKAFQTIKKEGKALYCGVSVGSNYEKGIELIEKKIVDTIQIYFSLLDFKPIKRLLPLAKKYDVGVIVAEPLAQGFLTGKYSSSHTFPQTDVRSRLTQEEIKRKVIQSKKFKWLGSNMRTLNQIALAYILSNNEVSTCIPGAKNLEQLESNVRSGEILLTLDELDKISEIQEEFIDSTS